MFGPKAVDVLTAAESANIAVAGVTTVYTKSFKMTFGEYFGVGYYVNSAAGSPDVTIQLEQSWVAPSTEGASDGNFTIPVGLSDIVTNLTTEQVWYIKTLSPIAFEFGRFKITGNSGNNADTIVNMKFSKQENI